MLRELARNKRSALRSPRPIKRQLLRCLLTSSSMVGPPDSGTWPVSASYSTTLIAYQSAGAPTCRPATCSGPFPEADLAPDLEPIRPRRETRHPAYLARIGDAFAICNHTQFTW